MTDFERSRASSGEINIQVNVESTLGTDGDATREGIKTAIDQKLSALPTDIFATLNDNSSISLIASVRPRRSSD